MAAVNFGVTLQVTENGKKPKSLYSLVSDIDGQQTLAELLAFTKEALISISTDVLRQEQENGFDAVPVLIVDGKFGKKLDDVNPLGKIQYVARQSVRDIIEYAFQAILIRTKIATGEYGTHNVVTFNGKQVANNKQSLKAWLDSKQSFDSRDIIRFINTAPYARRLESLGISNGVNGISRKKAKYKKKSAKNQKTIALPNGTYSLAYKAIQSKYKNNSFISYRLVSGSEVNISGNDSNPKTGKTYRRTFAKGKSKGSAYFYPSILISVVGAGITDGTK